jgi:hypothetical protein
MNELQEKGQQTKIFVIALLVMVLMAMLAPRGNYSWVDSCTTPDGVVVRREHCDYNYGVPGWWIQYRLNRWWVDDDGRSTPATNQQIAAYVKDLDRRQIARFRVLYSSSRRVGQYELSTMQAAQKTWEEEREHLIKSPRTGTLAMFSYPALFANVAVAIVLASVVTLINKRYQ